jgi:serine/threonine-protein kinase
MNGWMRWAVRAAAAVALVSAADSLAAEPSAADKTAARALFDEGRRLAAAGQHAQACPKFEESQRLAPGAGTLFNLADCYEQTGKTATAWSSFLEVAAQSKIAGQTEREKVARDRAATLEPKLVRLEVVVPDAAVVAGLEVRRDGSLVGKAMWGQPVPVDPGSHTLEAAAPGKKPWSTSVQIAAGKPVETVTIPVLENAPEAPAPVVAAAASGATGPAAGAGPTGRDRPDPAAGGTQRTVGLVVGGAGVIGVGLGVYFGLSARSKSADSEAYCAGGACWDARGVDLRSEAGTSADIATVAWGVGLAALAAGAVLYFTAPQPGAAKTGGAAAGLRSVALAPGGIAVKGAW